MSTMPVPPTPDDRSVVVSDASFVPSCDGASCQRPAAARSQCPWQTEALAAPLACVALRAIDGVGMLAVRRVETACGHYLHAQLSPRWPGCTSATSEPDQLPALLPDDATPMLCDLRHGTMSDFPGVLICCLRVAASRPGARGRLALLVADGAGEAQAHWMEALAGAVGVEAGTYVDVDAAVAWMQARRR